MKDIGVTFRGLVDDDCARVAQAWNIPSNFGVRTFEQERDVRSCVIVCRQNRIEPVVDESEGQLSKGLFGSSGSMKTRHEG